MAGESEDRRTDHRGAAEQMERADRLREDLVRLAGELAATEERVAAVRRQMASHNPKRAEEHLAVAEEAERCAAHERSEQTRWQSRG
jgi:hypothetical protein